MDSIERSSNIGLRSKKSSCEQWSGVVSEYNVFVWVQKNARKSYFPGQQDLLEMDSQIYGSGGY